MKEALKLALEALEGYESCIDGYYAGAVCPQIDKAITAIKEALAQPDPYMQGYADAMNWKVQNHLEHLTAAQPEQEPEFIKHEVENADDWSEWVCPDPKNYLMKCCDCGLVHEAEFGVVRYKSEKEREACDFVDDPNLQAVFRMRRSEQWSPEDTAHRAGGLPMEQPEQEPVAWLHTKIEGVAVPHRPADLDKHPDRWTPLYKDPKPCPTCEALARTVMMDQTGRDA